MLYLLAIIAILVQPIVGVINLPVLVIILIAARDIPADKAYLFAFFTGLAADLLLGNRLGTFAGIFLAVTLVAFSYKSRFQFNALSIGIFFVITEAIFYYARTIIR